MFETGKKTNEWFMRGKNTIPCGVNSNYRYWGDKSSLVLSHGDGGYVYDMDGTKYIDYRLGFGPVVFGHGNPYITEKVQEAAAKGSCFALTTETEILAAEAVAEVAKVDMVRFANSGTESTMGALRIARAYTGRSKILKFEGAYHGFNDYTLWNTHLPKASYRRYTMPVAGMNGVPPSIADLIVVVPFNDFEILEQRVEENWQDLAAIIIEPILGNQASIMPRPGFLEKVRELCDKYGIVMIMDEVKTGFRVAPGGAQELFNIKADLVTYAKCIGNGIPAGAIGGKAEIMGEIAYGQIPHGGTYAGHMMGAAAIIATMDLIKQGELDKSTAYGEKLAAGWKRILDSKGLDYTIQGPGGMPGIIFSDKEYCENYGDWVNSDHETYEQIILELFKRGVMPDIDSREPWFTCSQHTQEDLDYTLNAFEDAVTAVVG